jgi:glycosyltransferase involved in cell wall biosynthesis
MKKKILFVINTLGHAGAETAMLELMKRMKEDCYELSLYVLMAQGELIHRLPGHVKLINKQFCDASVLSKAGRYHMLRTLCRAAVKNANALRLLPYIISGFAGMIRKHRIQKEKLLWRLLSEAAEPSGEVYDLAIAYLEGGSAYYVAEHIKAVKKVAFIHTDYDQAGYTRKLDQECYLAYDRIFAVSEEVRSHFLKIYPECEAVTRIFHNIINIDNIIRKSQEPGGFLDSFHGSRILSVGRLAYPKAYDISIEVMLLLKKRDIPLRWYVLGEGPDRRILERKIKKYGLAKDFILLGASPNPFPYYRQTDLFLHISRYEGKSIAIQEAQVLGCAIVASDCKGNREQIVHEKDGLLCELKPDQIADSIQRIIQDETLRTTCKMHSQMKSLNATDHLHQLIELLCS